MIIYAAINKESLKVYVGQTKRSLSCRVAYHLKCESGLFPRALRKYGKDGFHFFVIDEATSKQELDEKEIMWIARLNGLSPHGYNLSVGGGGCLGWKASEEIRNKISMAKRGKPMPDAAKEKLRQWHTGRKASAETKQKLSDARKGRPKSEKHRASLRLAMRLRLEQMPPAFLGRKHSMASRLRMSKAQTGRIITPEHRRKIAASNIGKKASEETKQKMRAAHLALAKISAGAPP